MSRPTAQEYSQFTAEDFVIDPYFQDWVLNSNEETTRFWHNFASVYPRQEVHLQAARKLVENIRYKPYQLETEQKGKILKRVYQPKGSEQLRHSEPRVIQLFSSRSPWRLAAAIITILIVAGIAIWQLVPTHQAYRTAFGETESFTLSDGTVVTLNANSSLKVRLPEDDNQPREAWIEGEAFFEVKPLEKNQADTYPEQKKFLVHATGFTIEVLGTKFNVFSREQKSEVLLTSGLVKVESETTSQSEILQPGDLLSLPKDENRFVLQRKEKIDLPWRDNFFVFEETLLEDVARQIQDFYGSEVRFTSADLPQKRFTAKIPRDQPEVLIQAIEESFNVTITRKEGTIEIVSEQ